MPECIECGFIMDHVVEVDARSVVRCPQCDRASDIYYECDVIQKWIDVALLRRRAWAHILYNEPALFLQSIYIALFCCLLEAFVAQSSHVINTQSVSSVDPVIPLHYVQVVRIIKGPYFSSMHYTSTIPSLLFFSVEEYILISVAAAWMGTLLRRHSSHPLRRWLFVVGLANSSKVCYLIFLTFLTPSTLLPIVDVIFFVWLAQGFRTLLRDQPQVMALSCVFVCAFTRFLLRFASGWAPQFLRS